MEEFTLINKQRNRIKVFKPFEDISKPSQSINVMEIQYNTLASTKDQVNQLLKVQELNLLKMQERNISSYWKRVGKRQVYLKAIFKKRCKLWATLFSMYASFI